MQSTASVRGSQAHVVKELLMRRLLPEVDKSVTVKGTFDGIKLQIRDGIIASVWRELTLEGYVFRRIDDANTEVAELLITGKVVH